MSKSHTWPEISRGETSPRNTIGIFSIPEIANQLQEKGERTVLMGIGPPGARMSGVLKPLAHNLDCQLVRPFAEHEELSTKRASFKSSEEFKTRKRMLDDFILSSVYESLARAGFAIVDARCSFPLQRKKFTEDWRGLGITDNITAMSFQVTKSVVLQRSGRSYSESKIDSCLENVTRMPVESDDIDVICKIDANDENFPHSGVPILG